MAKQHPRNFEWLVLIDGEEHGPYTFDDLLEYARDGIIYPESILRPANSSQEYRADRFSELKQQFPQQSPVAPPPQQQQSVAPLPPQQSPVVPPQQVKEAAPPTAVQSSPVSAPVVPAHPSAVSQPPAAPQQSRNTLWIGLGGLLLLFLLGATGATAYTMGRSNPYEESIREQEKKVDSIQETLKELQGEKQEIEKSIEKLDSDVDEKQEQLRQIEDDEQDTIRRKKKLEGEIINLISLNDELMEWQKAEFALLEPGVRAVALNHVNDEFYVIDTSADQQIFDLDGFTVPKMELITQTLAKGKVPSVITDPKLVRDVERVVEKGGNVPESLKERVTEYWKPHQYLPIPQDKELEFVSFIDKQSDLRRVGLFAAAKKDSLEMFSAQGKLETISRADVLPGSIWKGTKKELMHSLDDRYFIDFCIFEIAHQLQLFSSEPSLQTLVIQVRLDEIEREEVELPPLMEWGTIEGGGVLGVLLAYSIANRQMNAREKERAEAKAKLAKLRKLEDIVAYLEDEMYARVVKMGVTTLERENRDFLIQQRNLNDGQTTPTLESIGSQIFATHALIIEVKPPRKTGLFHASVRLVDLYSEKILFADEADRKPDYRPKAGTFHLDSGELTVVETRDPKFKPLEKPLQIPRSIPRGEGALREHLVYLEPSPPEKREVVYRSLFDPLSRKVSNDAIDKLTPISRNIRIPFHDSLRFVICEISKRTRDIGGRILSITGEERNVKTTEISLGRQHGIKAGMRLRMFRDLGVNQSETGTGTVQKLIPIPFHLRITDVNSGKSTAEVVQSGMEKDWTPEFTIQTGDIAVSDSHRHSLLYVEKYIPGGISPEVYKSRQVSKAVVDRDCGILATRFMGTLRQGLKNLGIPMTDKKANSITHLLETKVSILKYKPWTLGFTMNLKTRGSDGQLSKVEKSFQFVLNEKQILGN